MNILKSKNEQKLYNNIAKRVVLRKNKFFRRNVHINHDETYLRILRIKNYDEFLSEVKGFKTLPRDICFFIYHLSKDKDFSKYLNINNSEYIITDSKTNKIIALNKLTKNYSDFVNIWIVKKNTIEFFKLELNDIFFTR